MAKPFPGKDVPVIDQADGHMSQAWYEYFQSRKGLINLPDVSTTAPTNGQDADLQLDHEALDAGSQLMGLCSIFSNDDSAEKAAAIATLVFSRAIVLCPINMGRAATR
jgi:hypothetical protein